MSFMACVRVTGLGLEEPYDLNWADFWLEIEACVGVLMVSITAFRTIFVSNTSKANRERVARPWYSSTVERLRARKRPNSDDPVTQNLPAIPSATMTGMRTFIAGESDVRKVSFNQVFWDKQFLDKPAIRGNSSIGSIVSTAHRDPSSIYSDSTLGA